MDSEIELVKVFDNKLIVRTRDDILAERYWRGDLFLMHEGKTYFCITTTEYDGYTYMRMVTNE